MQIGIAVPNMQSINWRVLFRHELHDVGLKSYLHGIMPTAPAH